MVDHGIGKGCGVDASAGGEDEDGAVGREELREDGVLFGRRGDDDEELDEGLDSAVNRHVERENPKPVAGSGAVAAAATGCCTTALLAERLLRAVDDGVRRPSPPDTRPVGVWVAAPLVSPWSERMDASSAVASRRS